MLIARNFHNVQIASPPEITHNHLTTDSHSENDQKITHGHNFHVLVAISNATKCRVFLPPRHGCYADRAHVTTKHTQLAIPKQ